MANFYDRPAESQVINTYVPIPFEEIVKAGQARQSQQDQTLQSLYQQEQAVRSMPYIPDTDHEKYMKDLAVNIDELAKSASGTDYSQAMNRRKLQDQLRNTIDLGKISTIQRSKEAFDKRSAEVLSLQAVGKYYLPYEKTKDPYLKGTLGMNEYNYHPTPFTDPEQTVGDYFKTIEPATSLSTNKAGYIVETTHKDLKYLQDAVNNDYRSFGDTPQGQWVVEQYNADHPNSGLAPEQIIKGYMNDVAKRYVQPPKEHFVGIDPEVKAAIAAAHAKTGKPPELPFPEAGNTGFIKNNSRKAPEEISKIFGYMPGHIQATSDLVHALEYNGMKFDKDDNIEKPVAGEVTNSTSESPYSSFAFPVGAAGFGRMEKIDEKTAKVNQLQLQQKLDEKYNQQKEFVNKIRKSNLLVYGKSSDLDVLQAYTQAYNNIENVGYNKLFFDTSEKQERVNKQVLKSMNGRDIMLTEPGKDNGLVIPNLEKLYSHYHVPKNLTSGKEARSTDNITLLAGVPGLGGYEATIEVNGVPKNFIISPNKRFQGITGLVREAFKLHNNGEVGDKKISIGGHDYIVSTQLQPTGNGQHEFASNIRTAPTKSDPEGKKPILDAELAKVLGLNSTNSMSMTELENATDTLLQLYR